MEQKLWFTFMLNINGKDLPCNVFCSERVTRVKLSVTMQENIEMKVPRGVSAEYCKEFATANVGWLARTLRTIHEKNIQRSYHSQEVCFPEYLQLDYFGDEFTMHYEWRPVRWTGANCSVKTKEIYIFGNLLKPGRVFAGIGVLLHDMTIRYLFPRLKELALQHGFQPGRLSVRCQQSRWASCSSRGGGISLNLLLILLPPEVVDYVLLHELCHLRHMNHSEAFWEEVEKVCPGYQRLEWKLKELSRINESFFEQIRQNY